MNISYGTLNGQANQKQRMQNVLLAYPRPTLAHLLLTWSGHAQALDAAYTPDVFAMVVYGRRWLLADLHDSTQ